MAVVMALSKGLARIIKDRAQAIIWMESHSLNQFEVET